MDPCHSLTQLSSISKYYRFTQSRASRVLLSTNHGSLQDLFHGLQLRNVVTCRPAALLKYISLHRPF